MFKVNSGSSQTKSNAFIGWITFTLRFLLQVVYVSLLGFLIGLSFYAFEPTNIFTVWIWPILFYLSVAWVSAAFHEAGHVFAFHRAGFRTSLVRIGPLVITRSGERWHFRLALNNLSTGLTVAIPSGMHDFYRRFTIGLIGGLLGGFVLTGLAAGVYALLSDAGAGLQAWLLATAGVSAVSALMSLVPSQFAGFTSDGAKLWSLSRKGGEAELIFSTYTLMIAALNGQRPRDWNPDIIQRLITADAPSNYAAYGYLMSYYSALDKGEIERASHFLDQALSLQTSMHSHRKAGIFLQAAYMQALYGGGHDPAKQWLKLARRGLLEEPHTRLRTEAAVHLAAGEPDQALAKAQEGLKVLQWSIEPGTAQAEADWLREIKSAAQADLESGEQIQPPRPAKILELRPQSPSRPTFSQKLRRLGQHGLTLLASIMMLTSFVFASVLINQPMCHHRVLIDLICKLGLR